MRIKAKLAALADRIDWYFVPFLEVDRSSVFYLCALVSCPHPEASPPMDSPALPGSPSSRFAAGAKQLVLLLRIGVGGWKRETVLSCSRNQLAADLHRCAGDDVHHQWTLQLHREGGAGFDTHVLSAGQQHWN